ncbi:hypothetical protein UFOVP274_39 [uncultured Caudovirales phage]|uniref:Uncharacterized protein n=1 Tax=uncultured Caudovirales phage TaxID=2100421 RepID=A0A6J5LJC5_9CAUD|nr:hypothetical protein UFOVP274_39 [uncultured Caudovirales phage]
MPLLKLKFKPGINREGTTLTNEGGWYECDKIRFRSGTVEKIGGWQLDKQASSNTTLKPYAFTTLKTAINSSVTSIDIINGSTFNVPNASISTYSIVIDTETITYSGIVNNGTYYTLTGCVRGASGTTAASHSAGANIRQTTGAFFGSCVSLWSWSTLSGNILIGYGTTNKFYIQNGTGGYLYDVTPIRTTISSPSASFAATNGSVLITVTQTNHGAGVGDFVNFSGATSLGGNITATILNAEFQIVSVTSANVYTIQATVAANASDTGNGGGAVTGAYQINAGGATSTSVSGWGAGAWSNNTWGNTSVTTSTAAITQARIWSQANYGQDLIINARGGPLYYWSYSSSFNPATQISYTNAPLYCNWTMVSDQTRFVFAFGTNDYGSSTQNPMLIRWSAQEDYTTWTPAATNQAGSLQLSHGSKIVTAQQNRQEILVWTDTSLYSLQYLGYPAVWGAQILADSTSIMSPNCAVTVNNLTFWMGVDKFYIYSGRVDTLYCALRHYIFDNINLAQSDRFFAGYNEGYNEVWWFYASITGPDGVGTVANPNTVIDKYVVYNHLEKIWYYGNLQRTAWLDSPLLASPLATANTGKVIYHESGVDDGTVNPALPINAYVTSSDMDIEDGDSYGFVWRVIPDMDFDGSNVAAPTAYITLLPRRNPGASYGVTNYQNVVSANNYAASPTYLVQRFTQQITVRARGRQIAFKVGSNTTGVQWQVGFPRMDIRKDGRKT